MKIRNSFVSNSSSSSFVVGFKKHPQSVEEVHELLFGKESDTITLYDYYNLSTDDAAQIVFDDIKDQKPIAKNKILDEIRGGYFPGYPEYDYGRRTKSQQLQKEFEERFPGINYWDEKTNNIEVNNFAKKIRMTMDAEFKEARDRVDDAAKDYYKSIKQIFNGFKVYVFSYSDSDGQFMSIMEHGNIFSKLPHITISHH